jgi:hypothetical protein
MHQEKQLLLLQEAEALLENVEYFGCIETGEENPSANNDEAAPKRMREIIAELKAKISA